MGELQSNKNNISNIPGGFAIIPNALLGFLSDRACVVFLKIYQCQFLSENVELDGGFWIKLSIPYLATSLNRHRSVITFALDELIGLNIVLCNHQNRKNILYRINWEECVLVCDTLCKVSVKGRIKLAEMCFDTDFTPMSRLSVDSIDEIKLSYPLKQSSYGKRTNVTDVRTENARNFNGSYVKCNENDNVRTDSVTNIEGSYGKRTNMENVGQSKVKVGGDDSLQPQGSYVLCNEHEQSSYGKRTNIPNVRTFFDNRYIYKEINKENMRERSSQYKGEKDKNLFDYFSSRNLSLPSFDKIFSKSFMDEDLQEDDDDVIKSIKQVWGQLGYDNELPENNYIDLGTFRNILFHSWQQLKQDFPDYSLSENDIKNIFGFVVVEHEGADCLYIDPSKLQDISASVKEEPAPSVKETKYSDRTSRRLFIDSISEIAQKDDRLLTSAEFVALLLMDYAEDYSTSSYAVEVTKAAFKNLIKQFSEQSEVPVEDIQMLFKDLPQRGKVKISPQQLSPDKFFQYNIDHQQESEVEKLFQTKLAEQDNT